MAKKVTFTRESAERIARTVRKSEGMQSIPPAARGRYGGGGDGYRILVTKLTEAATQGGTYTCEIWDGASQASFSATGEMIEVYFRLGDGSTGDWVLVGETSRGYEAVNIVC